MSTSPLLRPGRLMAPFLLAATLLLGACNTQQGVSPLPEPQRETGAVLGGAVRNLDGGAVAGVVVTAEPMQGGMAASVRARLDAQARGDDVAAAASAAGDKSGTGRRATVTDSRGWYAFAGLEPGAYLVTTEARDHQAGRATATVPELRAAALAETTFVDIALIPTGTFHGVASLQNAGNHQSTVVYCQGTSYVAVTDLNGDYVMRDVPAGAYTLIATHGGWLDGSAGGAIAAAGDSVEVAGITLLRENNMPPMVSITSPVDGASVSQLMASFTSVASDLDGSIVLYEWDFEDDGVFEYSGPASTISNPYAATGDYRVKVRVTDDRGAIGLAVVRFTAVEDIYVSAATGSDINPGSRIAPVATITRGFDLAQEAGKPLVLIAAGSYNESVVLRDSVSVIGGLDGSDWTRSAGDRSTVLATSAAVPHLNVSSATITGLAFVAPAATLPGAPSIGLWLASCVDLTFNDCAFTSGAGADGAAISAAGNGNAGATGNPGQNGSPNNSGGGAGGSGAATYGTGGSGGTGGFNGNGSTGATASGGANGGTGGLAANSCAAFGVTGGNGNPGSSGNPGSNGSGTPSTVGSVFGISWVSSNGGNGTTGFPGFGGGGGGGGGSGYDQTLSCSAGRGGGGGGGGGGGQAGNGAQGGDGGGASLAVFLYNSSPTFSADCVFTSGHGGDGSAGGNGGQGGAGGTGGSGGAGADHSGGGGFGGVGGAGGGGGGGQGGPGGPSICLYKAGTSAPVLMGAPSMATGLAGNGGSGGLRGGVGPAAAAGPAGTAQAIYP
ncbi:MAG: PKD domain-containing protein [bacterium]|nr:PKD domain-containing protein [bacterium]